METGAQRLLHIAHARQDEAWVEGVLLPALGLAEGQYWTRAEDDIGALRLDEIERAVQACRYTLLVVSSAARIDQWAQFAAVLAQHLGVEEDRPRLLLLARDFEPGSERARELLPLRQRCLVCLDCSDVARTQVALANLAAQLALTVIEEPPRECPYPGLRVFGIDEPGSFRRTDLFFGRDQEGRKIVKHLRDAGRLLLVGPSGCGKSSLVRALVLPVLGQGADAMAISVARPGGHPDAALRIGIDALDPRLGPAIEAYLRSAGNDSPAAGKALDVVTGRARRLLYIDQFEEVFLDHAGDTAERAQFFARLKALGHVSGLALLLGMRADFYGDMMQSPMWEDFKDHQMQLAPLRGAALREAIVRPAERVGVHVEVDLVERLAREADDDRAAEALPLLQVALEQLWEQREWRYLSLASYDQLADGGRRGLDAVLARHADKSIAMLAEPLHVLGRRVLIDLVHLGDGRPDTRRRRSLSDLRRTGDDLSALDTVLAHLSARRLVVIGGEFADAGSARFERYVDLAHDVLITGWPALAAWIAEHRDALRTQRRLEARAAGGGILTASELPEFTRWVAWIDTEAGRALGATEALRALVRRSVARLAQLHQEAGRQRLLDGRPQEAMPYLKAAREMGLETESLRMLIWKAIQSLPPIPPLEHEREVIGAAFCSDGTRIVTASFDNAARVWDTATGKLLIAPLRHAGMGLVYSAVFSIDGTRIVTASSDKTAQVWDIVSGKPVATPLQHRREVRSAAFSPDGIFVVTASLDKTARVWDAATGNPLATLLGHQRGVNTAAFSPDGTRIVTASDDCTARVWGTLTGTPLVSPLQHQRPLVSALFSPDGTRIVTASIDNTARVWDAATGAPVTSPLQHQGWVRSATFSPDGTRVVTASEDKTARVWDACSGELLISRLEHQGMVISAAFSVDGRRVVTASADQTARIWDAATGKLVAGPLEHHGRVNSAAFSRDDHHVVSASDDMTACVWNASVGEPLPPLEHQGPVTSAVFSPDGTRIITGSEDGTARVWNAATGKPLGTPLEHRREVRSAVFSPSGTCIVTASRDGTAQVWDAATFKPVAGSLRHQGWVVSAAFSPDGARVATASSDSTARIWEAVSGTPLGPPLEHQAAVICARFSPCGNRVVTASDDKTAKVWDAATGKLIVSLMHLQEVVSAAFSPDGSLVVTASLDGTARIWDAATGSPRAIPLQHQNGVMSGVFSRDGLLVVTAGMDGTARVWDAATGKPLDVLLKHQLEVWSAVFSPDGTRILTASLDHTARIWDAATGKPLTAPFEHQRQIVCATFSPDATRIVTASSDKTARIWATPLDETAPEEWSTLARRSPFVLDDGVLIRREYRKVGT